MASRYQSSSGGAGEYPIGVCYNYGEIYDNVKINSTYGRIINNNTFKVAVQEMNNKRYIIKPYGFVAPPQTATNIICVSRVE